MSKLDRLLLDCNRACDAQARPSAQTCGQTGLPARTHGHILTQTHGRTDAQTHRRVDTEIRTLKLPFETAILSTSYFLIAY